MSGKWQMVSVGLTTYHTSQSTRVIWCVDYIQVSRSTGSTDTASILDKRAVNLTITRSDVVEFERKGVGLIGGEATSGQTALIGSM
jgi:hypothetical protein